MININTLDLNLLKVFNAIYQYRNVSAAPENIGLAQSSMSNALSRLRVQFDDQLFQRCAGGVTPTEKADELAPQVENILSNISAMVETKEFEPSTAVEELVIAASDLVIATLAPLLTSKLREKAPGVSLNFVALDKQRAFERLDNNEYQIAIATYKDVPARFYRKKLGTESFVCIASKANTKLPNPMSVDAFSQQSHVLMTLKADKIGVIDNELKKLGYARKIAMTCSQFLPLVEVVASTDLIATVPSSLSNIAERSGCQVFPLPFSMPSWDNEVIVTQKFYTSKLGRFILSLLLDLPSD